MNKKEDHEQIKIKTAYKYIPESLAKRITSIDPETMLASGRFTFYRDAFKIIKDYPIIGAGGGGWASLYFGYQSHLYWSNQVHNYFMQAWIETGTVGLLAIISIWITLFISVIRLIKVEENQQEKQEIWGIFIAALALGSHSIVDFNLSLGAVALLLWFLFGFIKGKTDGKFGTKKIIDTYKSLIKYYVASIIPCILLAVLSISLLVGYSYGQDGIQLAAAGDVVEAANSFYKASKYDPLTASYKADRGQLLNIISRSSDLESILSESEEQFKKAIALDRFNPKMHTYLGAFYLLYGDYEDGFVHLEEAVKLHPFNPTYYELLTEGYVGVAQEFIRMRHPEEAERFLNKALELIGQIQKLNKGSKQKMEITPKLILNLEKIAYMKNNLDRRSAYLDIDYITFALAEMIDTTNDDIPDLWEKVNTTDSYISTKIISRETGNYIQIRNDGKGGGYIRSEDFTLIPKQEYEITMQVKGDIQPGKIKTSIRSRTGQNTQFSATLNEVSDNWHELTFQFTTTDDIEPGKQYMRIDHAGGAGYIEIKDLYIWEN
ncbi:MAG TPA: hypothetical protein GX526_00535 [Thermoanaerobacterales bacterium]|nr:hypothetical protein [Thermoanaerobacterales bacterium]